MIKFCFIIEGKGAVRFFDLAVSKILIFFSGCSTCHQLFIKSPGLLIIDRWQVVYMGEFFPSPVFWGSGAP